MALKRRTERRAAARPENATQRFVVFRVGEELYGLEISGVREIDRLRPVTRVPQSLSFVEGVINLRGTIIPVIDLARRFGREAIAPDRRARIVIAGLNGQTRRARRQRRHRGAPHRDGGHRPAAAADLRAAGALRLGHGAAQGRADHHPQPRAAPLDRGARAAPAAAVTLLAPGGFPHATDPVPGPHAARGPRRGRGRLAPPHAARRHDPQDRRRRVLVPPARPARAAPRRGDRARGDGPRRRARGAPAGALAGRALARDGPLGPLRQGADAPARPARPGVLPRPDARGGRHRPRAARGALLAAAAGEPLPDPDASSATRSARASG